jgi:hypothetical protein
MKRQFTRRRVLGSSISLAALPSNLGAAPSAPRDFLKELGVRPIINGAGVYTFTTASLMRPEVVDAILSMSEKFVRVDELHDAVGKRIAQMLGTPAAMIPSGAAAGLTLGTAAVLTGKDPDRIRRIPDLTGMKTEVIVQKPHRFPYHHMIRNCGVRLVEVESRKELERAINPNTAMLLFLNKARKDGKVGMEEFVAIGKKHVSWLAAHSQVDSKRGGQAARSGSRGLRTGDRESMSARSRTMEFIAVFRVAGHLAAEDARRRALCGACTRSHDPRHDRDRQLDAAARRSGYHQSSNSRNSHRRSLSARCIS